MKAIVAANCDDNVTQCTLLLSIVEALMDKAAFELAIATTTQTATNQNKVHYESILLHVHQQSLSSRIYDLQNDDWKALLRDGTALVDNFGNNDNKFNKHLVQGGVESARDITNGETDKAAVIVLDEKILAFVQSRADSFKQPNRIIKWLVYHDISTTDQFMQLVQQFAFRKKVKWFGYGRLRHAADLWYGSLTVPAKAVLDFIQSRVVQGDFWFPRRLVHKLLTYQPHLLSPVAFHAAATGRRCWMRTKVKPHRFPIFRRALADWYKTLKNLDEANHISPVDSTENTTDTWDGDEAPINENRNNDAATTATSDEVAPFDETQDTNTAIPINTTTTLSNNSPMTTIPDDVGPMTQDVGFVVPYLANSQRPTSPGTSKTVTTDDDDSPASSSSARRSTSTIATEQEEQEEAAETNSTLQVIAETIDSSSQPSTLHHSQVYGYSNNFYPDTFTEQEEKQEEGSGVPEVLHRTWFISDLDPKGKQKIEAIVVDPTPPPTATTNITATNGSQASGSSCSWVKALDSPNNDKKQDNYDDDSSLNRHGFTWENPVPAPTRNTNDTDNDEDENDGTVWV